MTTPDAPAPAPVPKRGPWRRFRSLHPLWQAAAWLLAAFAVYVLAGFLALPPLSRGILRDELSKTLSRPVSVGEVRFNPFSLRLEVADVAIGEPGGDAAVTKGDEDVFASLDLLVADLSSTSLFRLAVVLDEVRLQGPYVHLVFGPGGSNIHDLLTAGGDGGQGAPGAGDDTGNGGGPLPLMVRDFSIAGGEVVVDDDVRGQRHTVEDLSLDVPLVSSLPGDAARYVRPGFSAVVDGSRVELSGRAKPFADSLRSQFEFKLAGVDLTRWWPYVPAPEALKLSRGTLDMDMAVTFERGDGLLPRVGLSGDVDLAGVSLDGPEGPLLAFRKLSVELERFGLLEREVRCGLVRLEGPVARLALAEDGTLDWAALMSGFGGGDARADAAPSDAAPDKPFVVVVRRAELDLGKVSFTDRSAAAGGGFSKTVEPVDLAVDGFSTAPGADTAFSLAAGPEGGERLAVNGTMSFGAQEEPAVAASGHLALTGADLTAYRPYYASALPLALRSGTASLRGDWSWGRDGKSLAADGLHLGLRKLAMALPKAKEPFLRLPAVDVGGVSLDLDARRVAVASAGIKGGSVRVERLPDGRVDVARALAGAPSSGSKDKRAAAPAAGPDTGWSVSLGKAAVSGLQATWVDRAAPGGEAPEGGVKIALSDVAASVEGLATNADKPLPVALSAKVGQGGLSASGELTFSPPAVSGDLDVSGLALRNFAGYLPAEVDLYPSGGELDLKGSFGFQAATEAAGEGGGEPVRVHFTGAASLAGLSATDGRAGQEVAGFDRLDVRGAAFSLEPLELTVSGVTLDAPRAHLVREADGRMNLARLLGAPAPPSNATAIDAADASSAEAVAAPAGAETPATATNATAADASGAGGDFPFKRLAVSEFRLTDGLVTFRDLTLDPAFASELSKLDVRVGGLTMPGDVRAAVSASALQDGQAPVSVTGSMGMAGGEVLLDLDVTMDNYGMTRLTPYTLRAIAYPITRGKLDLDVGLKVHGPLLDMDNVMHFSQLAFGDKQDVPGAADVPIGLAMALLADGQGNMDLDVPVQGRLDDPQFRVGKVVIKAILNLLWKVATSPFALVGSLFGGDDAGELDKVAFQAGRARLTAQAASKLDTLAKALAERPRLELEVTGRVDPALDGPALADRRLESAVKRAKLADMDPEKAPESPDEVRFEPGQYEQYLRQVFDDADLQAGDDSVQAMEKALREHFSATPADLDDLASRRAGAVRTWLLDDGHVAPERIFIQVPGPGETGAEPGARVDLRLK